MALPAPFLQYQQSKIMPTRLVVGYDRKELNARLKSIIEVQNRDCLTTHAKQIFLFKDSDKISGNLEGDVFSFWVQNSKLTGAFYPVIKANIKSLEKGNEISIDAKMNIVGFAIVAIIFVSIAYGILTTVVIQKENEFLHVLMRGCVGIVMLTMFMSLPVYLFVRTLKIVRKHLITELIAKK